MFQYSTETIINSNNGNLPIGGSKVRYAAVTMGANGIATGTDAFIVDGVGLYHKNNIKRVTVAEFVASAPEIVKITVPAMTADEVYRLAIYTSQEGLSTSTYADAQLFHKKPFFYEITATGVMQDDIDALVALINGEMQKTDFNYFTAAGSATEITLTADDCYTRFQKVRIDEVALAGNNTGWEDYVPTTVQWVRKDSMDFTLVPVGTTVNGVALMQLGTEGAGTVARLIKNLRIPTDANTNVFGADTGGKPIPNGQYDQVTIEYETDRRHIGGQVMGAKDVSLTTHTFFVEKTGAASFVTELASVHAVDETIVNPRPAIAVQYNTPVPGSKQ